MTVKDINDDNSLIEVYLHWLLDNGHDVDKVGHIQENHNLGIYYIWNLKTNKYCVMSTNYDKFKDKRIKKPITRYLKSVIMFYPVQEEFSIMTDLTFEETLRFLGKGDRESIISFLDSQNFEFIQEFLRI